MNKNEKTRIELPALKKTVSINDTNIRSEIFVDNISDTYVIRDKNNIFFVIVLVIVLVILLVILYIGLNKVFIIKRDNVVSIKDIEIVNYYVGSDVADIAVVPCSSQKYCATDNGNDKLEFRQIVNDRCYLTVDLNKQYVYFKNSVGILSEKLLLDNYVVHIDALDKQYVPLDSTNSLYNNMVVVGEPTIKWVTLEDVIQINDNKFYSKNIGRTNIQAIFNNRVVANTEVIVTDVIISKPKTFDNNKKFLTCEVFSYEEAMLLDEILAYRIEQAGYGTRAGAVEAARFLTLEFPYRISYYWESGRLNNTGKHYVDGEGRYYHKGLYLDSSKYDSIEASLFEPAMWGCKLMSYEDDPPNFVPGVKYPNGLDCSGFVTWSLLNGGFDVGDRGAGESPSEGQLTDLGEFRLLTNELINSGNIKVGDLFNFWGHIAILIGQDDDNYYIAESLNNYKGVVVKTYSKKKVKNTFKYVVLMDDVYNGDGNLTNLWY